MCGCVDAAATGIAPSKELEDLEQPRMALAAILRAMGNTPPAPWLGGSLPSAVLVECIAHALSCAASADMQDKVGRTILDCVKVPDVPIAGYVHRLHAGFRCSDSVFVSALILLDRLLGGPVHSGLGQLRLTVWNVHRMFLTCLILSAKYAEDGAFCNAHYGRVGGIHIQEVNRLEKSVFEAVNYNLRVEPEEYTAYIGALGALSLAAPEVALRALALQERAPVAPPRRRRGRVDAGGEPGLGCEAALVGASMLLRSLLPRHRLLHEEAVRKPRAVQAHGIWWRSSGFLQGAAFDAR